jgi:hypothetical protein
LETRSRATLAGMSGDPVSDRDGALHELVDARTRWDVSQRRWGGAASRAWRNIVFRERPEPIPSLRKPVEEPSPLGQERIGICCSGGGIRSAAFNLGGLQALQEGGELQKASYLAAVSGGSYIAAAFAMVAKTWKGDPHASDNGNDNSDPALVTDDEPPFAPGSPEEQYLRSRSSYLAPDWFGKLFLLYRVIVGLLFNVLFLAAPLFAVMLILGWWPFRMLYPGAVACASECHLHVSTGLWVAPVAIGVASLSLGLVVLLRRLKNDPQRRGLQVWSTRLLIFSVLAAVFLIALPGLVVLTHNATQELGRAGRAAVAAGGSLTGLIAGLLAYLRETVLTPKRALKAIEEGRRAIGSKVRLAFAYAAAALAGPVLAISVMALGLSVSLGYRTVPKVAGIPTPLAIAAVILGVFAVVYFWSDLTSWSLHPFYKRQLCTAFALKRVNAAKAYEIDPSFKERLEKDESGRELLNTPVAVERNYDDLVLLSDTVLDGIAPATSGADASARTWPTLIVCAAANVSDPGATPPGRSVTSFTFSAHSIGGPLIGSAPTAEFERAFDGPHKAAVASKNAAAASKTAAAGWTKAAAASKEAAAGSKNAAAGSKKAAAESRHTRRSRDLTLPSAVAISGAAVAPSMGKLTRRPLTFLLALANFRLGVWLPNPRWVRELTRAADQGAREKKLYGRPRPGYLVRELFGRNRIDARYLFVTDGGHYENLGLVELLRRGCTEIYCFDASSDGQFGALGDAIALARSELGVEIKIDPSKLAPRNRQKGAAAGEAGPAAKVALGSDVAEDNVAEGRIVYRGNREGVLIYARCVMTGDAPWDVVAHHYEDPMFPHNSTMDQLYTDQKFESYRALGALAGRSAIERMSAIRLAGGSANPADATGPAGEDPSAPSGTGTSPHQSSGTKSPRRRVVIRKTPV